MAPVLKVTGNRGTAERMAEHIDLDVSPVIHDGVGIEEMGRRLLEQILSVCGGELSAAERHGHEEFSINRIGPTI